MPRTVKNKDTAIERLTNILPGIHATKDGRNWTIGVEGSSMVTVKTKSSALAWLADLAKYKGLDPSAVGWAGTVPSRGLAAWEESALEWLGGWQ